MEFEQPDMNQIRKSEDQNLKDNYPLFRWYRLRSEADFWRSIRLIITVVLSCAIGFGGYYFFMRRFNVFLLAVVIGLTILAVGLLVNQDLRSIFIKQKDATLDIHESSRFYFLEGRNDVIFVESKKFLTGVGIFEVKDVPLMISGNLKRFMRNLYQQGIPTFWVYAQAPLTQIQLMQQPVNGEVFGNPDSLGEDPSEFDHAIAPYLGSVRVLFGMYNTFKVTSKRTDVYQEVASKLLSLNTLFRSVYPHSTIQHLRGQELSDAFKIILSCGVTSGG